MRTLKSVNACYTYNRDTAKHGIRQAAIRHAEQALS